MPPEPIGHQTWVIPGGRVPLASTGREPDFTSCDELSVLNTAPTPAKLQVMIYHARKDPVGPYQLTVAAERVLQVRINDLIDPEAVPLDEPYACVIQSDTPVVVQFTRRDTSQPANAIATALAFPWAQQAQ
jgi:hypothetical protein